VHRFCPRDYIYLQQTTPTTLDVTAGRIILRVREVLGSGVLLLEGCDGKLWKDHTWSCAPCHLPYIDGMAYPSTSHIPAGLRCGLCGSAKRAATMVICDICSTGWHLECLIPPLLEVPVGQRACPECVRHSRGQYKRFSSKNMLKAINDGAHICTQPTTSYIES
jgi:hypothetical protein